MAKNSLVPREFKLGERFHVWYDDDDEQNLLELEVTLLHDDGTIDVAEVEGPESPDPYTGWSILPIEWPRYYTLVGATGVCRFCGKQIRCSSYGWLCVRLDDQAIVLDDADIYDLCFLSGDQRHAR